MFQQAYRTVAGRAKRGVAWFGAWLRTPVAGAWFHGLNYSIDYIPAILGAIAEVILAVDVARMVGARS